MQYVNLGRTGLKVSRLCLGMMTYGDPAWRSWVLPEEKGRPIIRRAIESGVNFFDTADMYSLGVSEEITGRALKDFSKRDEVVIATKVFNPIGPGPNDRGLSRKHVLASIDQSLRRLGTDYVDLYQIHRWDPETPIDETLSALHDIVRAGKARYVGASSMYAWQFSKALYLADLHRWTRFVSMQNHYNLVYREEEREMIPLCLDQGVAIIPWSPLARGFLTGTRRPSDTNQAATATARAAADDIAHRLYYAASDFRIVDRVVALANGRGLKPAQVALAWLLGRPGVVAPIIGASRQDHLDEALDALEINLVDEERRVLEEPYEPHAVKM